jgi:hypothetical protein
VTAVHDEVARALRLRRWAIGILGSNRGPSEHQWADVRGIPLDAWRVFLDGERCASPLVACLSATAQLERLSKPVGKLLGGAAALELQRVLTARQQLRQIGQLALREGLKVIVLKGGVPAAQGVAPPLALADIDLLIVREHVQTLVSALERAGLGAAYGETGWHIEMTGAPGIVQIEVHWTTYHDGRPLESGAWDRSISLDRIPGLWRLGRVDHLLHLLAHAVVYHVDPRVSLRDALLIGGAAAECDEAELDEVRRLLAEHEFARPMATLLGFAQALHGGAGNELHDPFVSASCVRYVLRWLAHRVPRSRVTIAPLMQLSSAALGGPAERGRAARAMLSTSWYSAPPAIRALRQRHPRLGALVTRAARLSLYSGVALLALPFVWTASYAARAGTRRGAS